MESVRLLIALAAHGCWEIHHMDVKSAFLNGDLAEEVYVQQPPGFINPSHQGLVLKLRKALYGLCQAPRAWNSRLDASLSSLGFERSPTEHAIYRREKDGKILLVGVYVDDLIITGSDTERISEFKQEMCSIFKMSDLGLLSFYLGIEVRQEANEITLCQSNYAKKILQAAGMAKCNPSAIPMEAKLKLTKEGCGSLVDPTEFRSIVGSLRYLVNTRPDIAYAVGIVSRYMEKPTDQHKAAVKQILRYIQGTVRYGCTFRKNSREVLNLLGYSDSDLAGDLDDRKSTSGFVFLLGGNLITWSSQKQKIVALSSCEAEYMAAAMATCQGIWLSRLISDLLGADHDKFKLKVDNMSAIELSRNLCITAEQNT
ncbi:uncharacterized mitochondrial protein AtMg00810-like [Phragmites australis]|uniref:uncharacterized mitochondrial protein AtMg00810-like n=1 Tax=Phragmites australis TaxID=29695 RepID=UPI002D78E18A|nr:uncharacterized mitochondrial protein AtMg00810-like [Phragmites australis]